MPIVGDLLAGRFRVTAALGAGGMASVWRAHDERLDRDVAVKVLLPNLAADPALATRFDREARALAAASHPGIVAIFDVEPGDPATGREPFYVMELCDGGSLADRLASGPLPPDDAVHILAAVAEGLTALHDRGIIHRDVKPANILMCGGRPKLADFGLARPEHAAEASALTTAGLVAGTLAYLAPETIAGEPATTAGDVYALGVVAYQALTGSLPRSPRSIADLADARHAAPPHVSQAAPTLGDAFDSAIGAALAPDPHARSDALGLAADLAAALGRWHRAAAAAGRSRPAATAAAVAPSSRVTPTTPAEPVDSALHTVVIRPPSGKDQSGSGARRGRPGLLLLAVVAATIVGLAALSGVLGGGRSARPTIPPSSIAASASIPAQTPTQIPSPTPTPTPTVAPTPPPTPTPDPAAPALAALDEVRAAIEAARRDGGLKRSQANELQREADEIGAALRAGDFDVARQRASRLADKVDDLDDVDDDEHDALVLAVERLRTAIP